MLFSPSPKRRSGLQLRISERRLLLMAGDTLAVLISVLLALYIWSVRAEEPFTLTFVLPQSFWFFVLVILWLLLASANDFYDLAVAANRLQSLARLALITGQMLLIYLIIFFFSPRDALPRLFILYYGVASFGLIALWRLLNPALFGWAAAARQVLIVGADESAELMIEAIRLYGADSYDVRGIISQSDDVGKVIAGVPVIGTGADLPNFVMRDRITELIITTIPDMDDDIFRGVMQAYEIGVSLVTMPILYARLTGRVPVRCIQNNWALVLPISGQSIFNPYPFLQRVMDISLSLIVLFFLLGMLPILAVLIRLDSKGGVFYSQVRTGMNGKPFRIYKFRTMHSDAEADGKARFSVKGDPRVTRMGRIMRPTRLDELPQVWNVIKGDMSIVGPRPERPEHIRRLEQQIPFYRTRLVIRPGVTGWAQVKYQYGSTDEDALIKLEYDLYYIRNQSILLDINILIRTVYKVIRMSGI
ncbi:MAG: exopolysaccharide biosynthesis polyprenyl glycosylphosphotransferase [Phototrophicales bacterium]